ncbi:putative secreted effector protein [Erysiphe neolycopersici]|uniref:Putative secreted effector protein n=1 Tax=Erysiphe neolycopersici TaxID=212602 RepID=A0A420HE43_9PEZI|nr:putative secreted effector protein [Erysiphe neolycopersici]
MQSAKIVVTVDYFEPDVEYVCDREVESCLEQHKCYKKDEKDEIDESCGRKNKCYEKKDMCLKNYNCNKKSKICHKKTTKRYGFRCGDKFYKQSKVLAAAKAACKKIGNNSQSDIFPALHTAFGFEQAGPYVEWPVTRDGRFYNRWRKSKRRIVMTMDCGVVGAVIRHKKGDYTQCEYESH